MPDEQVPVEPVNETDGQVPAAAEESAPPAPQRHFVAGVGWLTSEELLGKYYEMANRQHEPEQKPSKLRQVLDSGEEEPSGRSAELEDAIRDVVMDTLSQAAGRAQTLQTAEQQALAAVVKDSNMPGFDRQALEVWLASGTNPEALAAYNSLRASGQHLAAFKGAWAQKLLEGGKKVNRAAQNAASMPPGRRGEETRPERAEGTGRKIPADVLASVRDNPTDQAKIAYMRHRRPGTTLDLETEPPPGTTLRSS